MKGSLPILDGLIRCAPDMSVSCLMKRRLGISETVCSVLERNPVTLADVKTAAREVEQFKKDYERLWRREDESIPEFVPVRPRMLGGATVGQEGQVPYVHMDTGPLPLAVRTPKPMLALLAPRINPHIEEIGKRLGASHEGF